MITISGLSKSYDGVTVVDDISLDLPTGSFTVIVGTSGSGKSTLLRMVNRLIEPDGGEIVLDGILWSDIPLTDLRRRIGYVIQDHGLFPHWSVARNIGTVPRLLGWGKARTEARVREVMALLSLDFDALAARSPAQLSGGQAQRVGVARALAANPDILLMDEPFGALDPVIRKSAQAELSQVHRRIGSTILLVTHDMAEALMLADRIAVMDAGRIVQFGTPDEIVARPATPFVRSLIAEGERAFRHLGLQPVEPLLTRDTAEGAVFPADGTLADALSDMIWSGRSALPVPPGTDGLPRVIRLEDVLAAGRAP